MDTAYVNAPETAPEQVQLEVKLLDPELGLPSYQNPLDAGLDLCARESVTLAPGQRATVPTGLALALPAGYAGFVHPRSGLAARCGLTVVNSPGTIDAGYRGEVLVTLLNTDTTHPVTLNRGDRIAQLIVQRVCHVALRVVDNLPDSARGNAGHGSTGGFTQATAT